MAIVWQRNSDKLYTCWIGSIPEKGGSLHLKKTSSIDMNLFCYNKAVRTTAIYPAAGGNVRKVMDA
jgi:hypothetical protein